MRLRRLELQNFRQHAGPEVVHFEGGITGILGANESGKSTLIEAVSFALYGSKAIRGTMAGLVWNRAPARSKAGVELEFEVGGITYEVQRGGKRASLVEVGPSSDAEVPCYIPNPQPLAEGISAVDEAIESIVGMTWEEFSTTYLCRQRDLGAIAAMGPTERRRFVLKVLGVGKIEEALSKCRGRKNELRAEAEGMAAGLGEREPLEAQVNETRTALEAATVRLTATTRELQGRHELTEAARGALCAEQAAKETHEELARRLGQANTNRTRALEETERVEGKIEEAEPPDPERLEGYRASLARVRDQFSELEAARKGELASEERTVGAADADYVRLANNIDDLAKLGAEAKCPTCRQELGAGYVETVEALEAERDVALARLRGAQGAVARLAEPTSEEGEIALRGLQLESNIGVLEARAATFAANAAAREELARWQADQLAQDLEIGRCVEAIATLAFDPAAHTRLLEEYEGARALETEAREGRARAEAEEAANKRALDALTEGLAEYDRRAKALGDLRSNLSAHEGAADRLAAFRAAEAERIEPELEALASGFVHLLTDGRHEGLIFGDGLTPRLLESGLEAEVLSGGTEDIAAIAIRLAVSQMIAERAGHPLSLLILDEPFGSLDAVRRDNVLELIRRLGGVFEQVLLVTHVDTAKDAVDHVISVLFDEAEGKATIQGVA